jgi:hypothetical protein
VKDEGACTSRDCFTGGLRFDACYEETLPAMMARSAMITAARLRASVV